MRLRFFVASAALIACSGGETDAGGASSAGAGGSAGSAGAAGTSAQGGMGGTVGQAGTSSAGGPTCDGQTVIPNSGGGGKSGLVSITVYPANGTAATNVAAVFASGGYGLQASDCAIAMMSSCVVRRCQGASPLPAPKLESAGTLTVSGGSFPITMMPMHTTLDPNMSMIDIVYGVGAGTALFVGGETLTVAATGDALPAFTTTVTAPPPIGVSAPQDGAMLDPANATFAWPAGDGETFVLVQLSTTQCGVATQIACSFLASDGQGLVPQGAFDGVHGAIDVKVSTRGTAQLGIGDFQITVDALNETSTGPTSLVLP